MSGYNNYSDPDDFEESQGSSGSGLRKQLENALGEIKKLNERLEGDTRKKSVDELLRGKGIDPAVAAIIPPEADPNEWVEKHAHLLAAKPGGELLEDSPVTTSPDIQAAVDDDPALVSERRALAEMRDAAESGSPTTVSTDLLSQMDKINDPDELMKFFRSHGAGSADF